MGHTELNLDERRTFYRLREAKLPMAEIARVMGRHRSSLYREVKRNFYQDQEVPAAGGYFPVTAQNMAEGRRRRQCKLIRCPQLREVVIDRLRHDWSPEQVAGRLKVDGIAPVTVSHETIYKFIYSKSGKAPELGRLLPSRRKKRVPRYARKARGNVFPDTVSIKHRPNCINERKEFGHWEGDLMIFERAQGNANIVTIVERKSRYTVLFKNNNRRSRPLMDKLIGRLSPLPATARQSITLTVVSSLFPGVNSTRVWA